MKSEVVLVWIEEEITCKENKKHRENTVQMITYSIDSQPRNIFLLGMGTIFSLVGLCLPDIGLYFPVVGLCLPGMGLYFPLLGL